MHSSSAPLTVRTVIDGIVAIQTSEYRANKEAILLRSPGYIPSEYSAAGLEFKDSERSVDSLKKLARTMPTD